MLGSTDAIGIVTALARQKPERHEGDFEENGILICGKCKSPRQAWIDWFPDEEGNKTKKLVKIMCRCDEEREKAEKERKEQADFDDSMKSVSLALHTMPDDTRFCFDMDENPSNPIARACSDYVSKWDEMRKENIGIIFYGTKGSGKTFYASCIYNALRERRVLVGFTSAPNLMTILGKWDKSEILDALTRPQMLVIDDLGAERDSSYSAEIMYSAIDARSKTGKPTIVTTNIDLADMESETDLWRSRIYDRIIAMCPIPLKMDGKSRRGIIASKRKQLAREILLGVKSTGVEK